jgi:hypothetical protein
MLNEASSRAVDASTWGRTGTFRRPLYDTYGFARIPATVEQALTGTGDGALPADVLGDFGGKYETVVVLLVDGFGWHLFKRFAAGQPFLRRLLVDGRASVLTAQFPSTTAAHMTTLHTGLPVSRSGVLEWYHYEPAFDAVYAPLLYSLVGDRERETLRARGPVPPGLWPAPTFYQRLAERGVASTIFQSADYIESTYSRHFFAGARLRPFSSSAAGLSALADEVLAPANGPRYLFAYLSDVDSRGHASGLVAPEYAAQVATTFNDVETHFFARVAGKAPKALLLMSADHGMTATDGATTVYVNQALPDLPSLLRTAGHGAPVRFSGSARDLFLHVREEFLDDVKERLSRVCAGKAEVWKTTHLLADGLFGPPPFDRLLPRLGNLVVLPYAGQTAYWFEEGRFWMKHRASHGGLTAEEMDVGLFALPLGPA